MTDESHSIFCLKIVFKKCSPLTFWIFERWNPWNLHFSEWSEWGYHWGNSPQWTRVAIALSVSLKINYKNQVLFRRILREWPMLTLKWFSKWFSNPIGRKLWPMRILDWVNRIENQPTHACKTAMLVPFQPSIISYF